MITEEAVKNALKAVKYPGYSRDIVSFGLVKQVSAKEGAVSVSIQLTSGTPEVVQQVKAESERVLRTLPGVTLVHVEVKAPSGPQATGAANPWQHQNKVPGIKRVVAVASGKGGVGKSTTSVNLACALKYLGAGVGLLDCDIYGPSIPLMMGLRQKPTVTEDQSMMVPPVSHGVKLMSMGFLVEGDDPVIWRGPMIMKTIQQFVTSVFWGELDYLVVDLPPGTGDAQLSLCQTVPLDGGVIVTTPQEASLGVVRKGIAMFEKVNVPIPWHPRRKHELLHHAQWRAGRDILGMAANMRRPSARKFHFWARSPSSPKYDWVATKACRWWCPAPKSLPDKPL